MNLDALLAHASRFMDREAFAEAISPLRSALSQDPENARAHALLSICLIRTRRRFAAEHEARVALSLEPELPNGHLAMGWVLHAQHALPAAERSFRHALALCPDDPVALRGLALVAEKRDDRLTAKECLEKALSVDPEYVPAILDLADLHLARGEMEEAEARIADALTIDPEGAGALAARGELYLRRGNVEEAADHALWALGQNATSPRALHLLVSVKARQNVFLGIWWRWNAWLTGMESGRRVAVLVGLYATYRCAHILFTQLGAIGVANVVLAGWLTFVIYTWAAIPIFQRMLRRELASVRLRPGF